MSQPPEASPNRYDREPGAADFAAVYLQHQTRLAAVMAESAVAHPVFGHLLRSLSPEAREGLWATVRRAREDALRGEWGAYTEILRREGKTYAEMGVSFEAWSGFTTIWSKTLVPCLIEAYADDPARLGRAIVALQAFLEHCVCVIGGAYHTASQALEREREEELATTLDSIADGFIATDVDGNVVRINGVAATLTGWRPDEARGQPLNAVFALEGTLSPDRASTLHHQSGRICAVEGSIAPIRASDGTRRGEVLVFRDVTALELRKSELARWEALFQNVSWGMCITHEDGRAIEVANPAFEAMYGFAPGASRGTVLAERFAPGEIERARKAFSESSMRTGRSRYEVLHQRLDGSRFPVLIDATRIPGPHGSLTWVVSLHDLTERRQIESLRERSAELEVENKRVQEASRLKSEFLANMSHELRTPLNSILGFSELLFNGEVGPLDARQQEFIGDIFASGKHLLRLINDVLDLSKIEAGKMAFHPEPVDLHAITREIVGVLRGAAHEKEITLRVDIEPDLGVVYLDPGRFKQVVYNFLSNALKFSPAQSEVELLCVAQGSDSFRVEVVDHGPGISFDDQRRLFREFEQLNIGRAKSAGGTGLGLALTRRLVEAQGGEVGVVSQPGQGSTFFAVLPRGAKVYAPPSARRLPGASRHAARILVIEDDPRDQDRMVSVLRAAGYAVDTAFTGGQALQACAERRYDAITLDLLLPDIAGVELLATLRKDARLNETPILVISVVSEFGAGGFVVHDVLPKPISPDTLVSSLRRAGVAPPAQGPVLVVDDDESSVRLMVQSLQQLGYRVTTAFDGAEALACARWETPSAVVLDLIMPGLDGFAFLQRFRAEPLWQAIPVLVWTVLDLSPEEHRSLLDGAATLLPKDGAGAVALLDSLRTLLPARPKTEPTG